MNVNVLNVMIWLDLVRCFQNILILPTLRPQSSIFGILDSVSNNSFFKINKSLTNQTIVVFIMVIGL